MSVFELTKKLCDNNISMEIGIDKAFHGGVKVCFRKDICGKTYHMNDILQYIDNEELFTYELMYYIDKFLRDCPSEEA